MISTLYSPSMVVAGGGGVGFCLSDDLGGFSGLSRTALKTGCMHFHWRELKFVCPFSNLGYDWTGAIPSIIQFSQGPTCYNVEATHK